MRIVWILVFDVGFQLGFFVAGADANICPIGHYCPLGTAGPEPCPKGSYNNETGLQAEGDCVLCPPGEYCTEVGMTGTSGLCDEG